MRHWHHYLTVALYTVAMVVFLAPTQQDRAVGDQATLTLCIEDTTRISDEVRSAVAELDSVPEIAATYHRGVGCGGNVVRVMQTRLPKGAAGIVDPDTDLYGLVKITDRSRLDELTDRERSLVVLHELMHIVLWFPPGWDDGGHVDRCDSVLSHDSACVLALDGLTGFDRAEIARRYGKEAPTP